MFATLTKRILALLVSLDPDVVLAAKPIQGDYCSGCCTCDHCNEIEKHMLARKRAMKRYGDRYCAVVRLASPSIRS